MTIERKDVEFILSHFEPPAFPRRISTALSHDGQYPAYSINFMLYKFQEAKELDCKINAYKYLGGQKPSSPNGDSGGGNGHGNGNGNGHSGESGAGAAGSVYDYTSNLDLTRNTVAEQIQQRAESEAAPTLIHIDLDRKNFSSDRTHENAVKKTIANIHEVFLIPKEDNPVTTYWSGGGTHILLPLEVDPAKYPVKNAFTTEQTVPGRDLRYARLFTGSHDYRFNANHKLPANLFLWFAEEYLTNGKGDTGHRPSVRSSMVRAPGSYNSKYQDKTIGEVKLLQCWDGRTKAHILFLLGTFYRNVGDDLKKQAKLIARARRVRNKLRAAQMALDRTLDVMPVPGMLASQVFGEGAYSEYAHNKYWYIDKLLEISIEDFRKRAIDLLLTPYLLTIKGMPDNIAEQIMINWIARCNVLRPVNFDPIARIQSKITDIRLTKFLPLGIEKFKEYDADLVHRLSVSKEIGGGN